MIADHVPVYPELAQAALRQGEVSQMAAFLVLHAASHGQGCLARAEAVGVLRAARRVGRRHADRLLQGGDGVVWELRAGRVWLHSQARVIAARGIPRVGRAHLIPLADFGAGMATLRAAFAATAYRTDDRGRPITRRAVAERTGVAPATQRRYEAHGHAQRVATCYVRITHIESHSARYAAAHHDLGFFIGRGGDLLRRHGDIRRAIRHSAGSRTAARRANRTLTMLRGGCPATQARGQQPLRAYFPQPGSVPAYVRCARARGKPGSEWSAVHPAVDYAALQTPDGRWESAVLAP